MRVRYTLVLGFASVLMFSLNASAQRTGNNECTVKCGSERRANSQTDRWDIRSDDGRHAPAAPRYHTFDGRQQTQQ